MRQIQQLMGMPVVIDIPGCNNTTVFDKAYEKLKKIDEQFSTYRTGSEVSRFIRGELPEADLSRSLKKVIAACRFAEETTDGWFSAWASGTFDPSGYVKGWAVAEASKTVQKQGFKTYCIGAGGDILARSDSAKDWSIGIQSPADRAAVIGVIKGKNFAVATSGNYERGDHIYNPKNHQAVNGLKSFSVTGRDIISADILATAGFAAGNFGLNLLAGKRGYEALVINAAGQVAMTKRMVDLVQFV